VFVAVGSIVSFAAVVYNEPDLSFIAGSISTVSLATLQFESFGVQENKKQSSALNTLLRNIDIKTMPIVDNGAEHTLRQTPSPEPETEPRLSSIVPQDYGRRTNVFNEELTHSTEQVEALQAKIQKLADVSPPNPITTVLATEIQPPQIETATVDPPVVMEKSA
jgi:hypothetical protein